MSHTINFLIAMVCMFLLFSILVSNFTEAWNSIFGKRGTFLWEGVDRLVGTTVEGRQITEALRRHSSIQALSRDDSTRKRPSYIPSALFADALTDVLLVRHTGVHLEKYGLAEAIALLPNELPLKQSLVLAWRRARGNEERFREEVARLFDDCMDRVSGWYKRDAQIRTFWIGLVLALVLNIDAVHIAIALWASPELSNQVAGAAAAAGPGGNMVLPAGIPVGWPAAWKANGEHGMPWHAAAASLGVVLMACTAVIGAPMWFQLLSALLPLRATGVVPPRSNPVPEAATAPPVACAPAAALVAVAAANAAQPPQPGDAVQAPWRNELERKVVEQGLVGQVRAALNLPQGDMLDEAARQAIRDTQRQWQYAPTGQLTRLLLARLKVQMP